MAKADKKMLKQLKKIALDQGWVVELSKGGHLKWISPDPDVPIIFTASTPSDHRAIKNIRASLKRAGLNLGADDEGDED